MEKEILRHKVIRLNRSAKGIGENSVPNMLKRITHDTSSLNKEFESLGIKYDISRSENLELTKKIREMTKLTLFLESEIKRRSQEFLDMTQTFENFLQLRAKHSKKDLIALSSSGIYFLMTQKAIRCDLIRTMDCIFKIMKITRRPESCKSDQGFEIICSRSWSKTFLTKVKDCQSKGRTRIIGQDGS